MDVTVTRAQQDRWPLRLVALLLALGAAFWVRKTGTQWRSLSTLLPLVSLVCASVGCGLAAARLSDGPLLARLCSALRRLLRLLALLVALPELIAQRVPVQWDVVFGLVPPESECPIYYRMPDVPFDDGRFLKRAGPDSWTGRPLNSALKMKRSGDVAYADEAPFTVRYDADGFRNPAGLTDWDALVAGDSFVELGSLPDGETITDQLAARTGWRVKNLGVASTGPLAHAAFTRHFGHARSCRYAVLVWSETALEKTISEWARLNQGGSPAPSRSNNSLLKAALGALRLHLVPTSMTRLYANAAFTAADGRTVPVMLDPPVPKALSATHRNALPDVLNGWATTARSMGMEPWLVFLPSKNRVWRGRLSGPAELIRWEPDSLPQQVEALCRASGVGFVDTTPALAKASRAGFLVFNPVVDGHPTKAGAEIIAKTMAASLGQPANDR